MYDKNIIIPGLIIFLVIVTFPFWYNHGDAGAEPKPELPKDSRQCVLPAKDMRATHMQLLNEWRDEVLRTGDRSYFELEGKSYQKGLQIACMKCHTSKKKFCDTCHVYTSVTPYCWDCHLAPVE
ncbi:MAG: sulfate reduction electron transfer complex DsrMKJOP subunit DsrJ [Desulfobulbaceae bacterium]